MPELWDRPIRHSVALRAVIPEKFTVRINRRVTIGAVQHGRIGCDANVPVSFNVRRFVLRDPMEQLTSNQAVHAIIAIAPSQLAETDFCQRGMVHRDRVMVQSLMFQMAFLTASDIAVKCRWLALQQRSFIRVASNALRRCRSFDRCVTGGAVMFQKCVSL